MDLEWKLKCLLGASKSAKHQPQAENKISMVPILREPTADQEKHNKQ